ncbi:MAG: CRISPR-associated endonuclease Cas2 [Thermodesulfobacteriota bacterium]|nr:CRISPR-associated endonuclease Cas2 [Thermodesulfobacteriota bacterium]
MVMIVAYDIAHARRLSRVAKVLLDYGFRVQKSVFYVQINDRQLKVLRERIEKIIDPIEDGVKYFPLCKRCADADFVIGAMLNYDGNETFVVV